MEEALPAASSEGPRETGALGWLLLALGVATLLFGPHYVLGDAAVRFEAIDALFARGEVSRTPYSLVGPLFSAPLWLLGRLGPSAEWWCMGYNFLLFVLGLALLDRLLRGAVGEPVRRRFLLLLVFASMFPHHVQNYGGEVFTAVLVSAGLLAAARRLAWGWPCVVLGAVNAPASAVGVVLAAGAWCLRARRLRYALAVVACAALVLLESRVRRGSALVSGYEDNRGFATVLPYSGLPGFSYPFFFGLLSILFSFGKGLVFFAPGLLLGARRGEASVGPEARAAYGLWLLFLAGLVVVYAPWWAWYGGWCWGPRFFLFASVPASFALAASLAEAPRQSLARNAVTLALLALSCWVGLNGAVFGTDKLELCWDDNFAQEHLTWYVPEFSVLWRPFVEAGPLPAWQWPRALVFAAGFCYLATPLLAVAARQAAGGLRDLWRAQPLREPWRF